MKRIMFSLVLLFPILFSVPQRGVSWESRKTLENLVQSAPLIVLGEALQIDSQREEYLGQKDFIFTYVKLNVKKIFKGSTGEKILTIRIPGGLIEDQVISGPHSFMFSKDGETLLFLNPLKDNCYEINSISGILPVVKNENGTYFDCSLLKREQGEKKSQYDAGNTIEKSKIIHRINESLSTERGE